jgi:hypothetical protein
LTGADLLGFIVAGSEAWVTKTQRRKANVIGR